VSDADKIIERCHVELGNPDAVYRVGAGRFGVKLALGLGLIGYGVVGNYLWWVHGPANFNHLTFLFLILPPLSGLSLLRHLHRHRGLCVLAYPTGLLRVQRGDVESYPWDDVDEVRLKADKGTIEVRRDDAGQIESCMVAVEPPTLQIGNAAVTVQRKDGVTARLTPVVGGYADLVERVQAATFPVLWPRALARFQAGEWVACGPFEASPAGLRFGKSTLPWAEVGEVGITSKNLSVKRKGKWLPWAAKELEEVPNPHVLLALIEAGRRSRRPVALPADDAD
jgi:hypothetical protein